MKFKSLYCLLFSFLLFQCQSSDEQIEGIWRAEVPTIIGPIPFNLEIVNIEDTLHAFAINGKEKLELDRPYFAQDSLHINMELFDAEIIAKVSDGKMNGTYRKKLGDLTNREGEFSAEQGKPFRFAPKSDKSLHDVSGKWSTTFIEDEGATYKAVGLFKQDGNEVNGTFLTEMGDYRFLAGNVVGDSLMLSCFDGTHIYLFKAAINGDSLLGGHFSSSLLYHENWIANRDDNAALRAADALSYMKEGFTAFEFSFSNTEGELVSLEDPKYQNKVVVVQLLGTWCPNCMDESRFLGKWIKENRDRGVEVIGLAFEKSMDHDFAFPKIGRMKERFGMDYEVLLAGLSVKLEAEKALPMLNHIMSFPTTVFLDKNHVVRKIHTGFSGPGTGVYYQEFVIDFENFMDKLLSEN